MIRGFARSVRGVVAQFSMVCICLTGIPVSASAQQQSQRVPPGAPLTLAAMKGMVDKMERDGVVGEQQLTAVRTVVAIASAPNAQQRSALIRRLPVSIAVTVQDGGVVKNFYHRGELRLSVVERAKRDREEEDEVLSGPRASESFATDASELCLDDEEPPCATEEEMDEAAMLAVYVEGESLTTYDGIQQEVELLVCCNAADGISSGPSATSNCATAGLAATGALIVSAATGVELGKKVSRARLLGGLVSRAILSTAGAVAVGSLIVAVAAVSIYIECTNSVPAPRQRHWFEPVY